MRGAREHNLGDVHVEIPHGRLTVITGVSGSGKSSLAFDTIHAEGQRRYLEGLAPRLRRLLGRRTRPDVDGIDGLPPTLAVSQLAARPGPRSTVGTVSEVHDLLRLLFAKVGTVHCPDCDRPVVRTDPPRMVEETLRRDAGRRFLVLAPLAGGGRLETARREGFVRVRIGGDVRGLDEIPEEPTASVPVDVVVDRLVVDPDARSRLTDSIETALRVGGGRVSLAFPDDDDPEEIAYSEDYRCAPCDRVVETPTPATLSFNTPHGSCPACGGLGETVAIEPRTLLPDPEATLGGALDRLVARLPPREGRETRRLFRAFARGEEITLGIRLDTIDPGALESFLRDELAPWLDERRRSAPAARTRRILGQLALRETCATCGGRRLSRSALAVRLDGLSIADLGARALDDARAWLEALRLPRGIEDIAAPVVLEARARLGILLRLGLGHLTLDRPARTLSGGELQRVRLGTRLGSELVGVLYVLDEPTTGLHPADTAILLETLVDLRDRNNTLVLVEHDPAVIRSADHLVEVGPGAGRAGGSVTAAGPAGGVLAGDGLTARALRGEIGAEVPAERRPAGLGGWLTVESATEHNLRSVDARIPLGCLVAVTGVSGAGKSTLARDVLLRTLRARIHADPIRPGTARAVRGGEGLAAAVEIAPTASYRSMRSVPATAAGLFGPLRRLFAEAPDARIRGFGPQRFSFNRKGGRCAACEGLGERTVAMDFLPDVRVRCDVCDGARFDPETLQVRFRGLDIAEILALSVEEARAVFQGFPKIAGPLEALDRVGLGYLPLGQPGRTLSGGETQRLRLAVELARPAPGPTLYLLDEPTVGLHPVDVARLVTVLSGLVDLGHSVVVVEHDPDVVKCADWVLDLGPGGGPQGGHLVVEGPPEAVAASAESRTAPYLATALDRRERG